MREDELLDADIVNDGPPKLESADLGLRFGNTFFDRIAIRILLYIIPFSKLPFPYEAAWVLSIGIYIGYYLIMEFRLGQTLGKVLTGTIVVNELGEPPSFKQVLIRFLVRHIPLLNALSFFFDREGRGWHDKWSKTYVIKKGSI